MNNNAQAGLSNIDEVIKSKIPLSGNIKPTKIIRFGSSTTGKPNPNDYDVAVFVKPDDFKKIDQGFWGVKREVAPDGKAIEYKFFEDTPKGREEFEKIKSFRVAQQP